jgi:general stress protein YciG
MTKCPKCGVEQDPVSPICIHMAGKKGGAKMAERGPEFFRAIGHKGGTANLKKNGREFLVRIGAKGGAANSAKHGPEHFSRIGKKGGGRLRALAAAGRAALAKEEAA